MPLRRDYALWTWFWFNLSRRQFRAMTGCSGSARLWLSGLRVRVSISSGVRRFTRTGLRLIICVARVKSSA